MCMTNLTSALQHPYDLDVHLKLYSAADILLCYISLLSSRALALALALAQAVTLVLELAAPFCLIQITHSQLRQPLSPM